jgi:hypothetical protein
MSRRSFLTAAMVTGTSVLGLSRLRGGANAQDGDVASALNDLTTAEGLLVTFLGVARTRATDLVLDENTVRLLRAAQCQQDAHYNNLVAEGGSPSVGTYTITDSVFENPTTFLTTWAELENIMIGMYMAAGKTFAEAGESGLVELAYAAGTVDAQHMALLRQLLGERLPANRAFVEWQFRDTAAGIRAIRRRNFIEGDGATYDYPGPGDRYCRGVTGLVPETSEDQITPEITPVPDASPVEA